mgnify:CR=1 FL=1
MIKFSDLLDTKDTAGVCFIHMGQNVLLLKSHKGKWSIPKGHIKHGEEILDEINCGFKPIYLSRNSTDI